jgi:acyl dehydratase
VGLYYEDFYEGMEIITSSRTVTETDVVAFGCLTGDFNPLHMDIEYGNRSHFGKRVAHGLLGLAFAGGFSAQTGVNAGTSVGFVGLDDWRFLKPIFLGDTIHLKIVIDKLIPTSKADRGVIYRREQLINQHGEVCQEGIKIIMQKKKAALASQQE